MIEDITKNRAFGIISYCDTQEKVDVLQRNILLIRERFPEYKIALQANYPLSPDIQSLVDEYYYQDLNFIHDNKWIYYWNIMINDELQDPYFNKKFFYSIQDIGFSVFQQIRVLVKHLIDYKWVMLINYDTSVEEIRTEDYSTDFDLTVHYFPDHKAVSLIIMFFYPMAFFINVAKNFTFENWSDPKRNDQLNEERFFDMIKESAIKWLALDYKISDKISGEPDYLKPNAPTNDFFKSYLLYFYQNQLEIYLWDLTTKINQIMIRVDGKIFVLNNLNLKGGYENIVKFNAEKLNDIMIVKINNIMTNIPLKIKPGYLTRPI